jgi:hypothetical protein
MLTIIFGAGASYDSDPGNPSANVVNPSLDQNRPPLAKDLFNQRFGGQAQENPAILALIPRLRRSSNVEEELEDIASSMSDYPRVYRQLLSMRNYLRSVIEYAQNRWRNQYIYDVSTYNELLDSVDRWQVRTNERVTLITFNYDTLLDMACEAVLNLKLSTVDAYVDNSSAYQLFKVHGSINWSRLVTGVERSALDSAEKLTWTKRFDIATQEPEVARGTELVPAIAIPTVTKTTFEFPDSHQEKLVAAIRETDHLLIIGWRGAEKHFLKLWREEAPKRDIKKIVVVTSKLENAQVVYRNNLAVGGIVSGNVHCSGAGFANFVANELHKFLL